MRPFIIALILFVPGCFSLNSDYQPNHSTLTMTKKCGCQGHESCATMVNCGQCCTPDSCQCHQVTKNTVELKKSCCTGE